MYTVFFTVGDTPTAKARFSSEDTKRAILELRKDNLELQNEKLNLEITDMKGTSG